MTEQSDDLKRMQYSTDWDLSDVKNMQDILKEELVPANWDLSDVKNMGYLFYIPDHLNRN